MKENETIDISFAGVSTSEAVYEDNTKTAEVATELDASSVEEMDLYANAVEAFFAGYQTFQEGMKGLQKFTQPKMVFDKLMVVLEAFQAVIAEFKAAEYTVPVEFQEGQDFVLAGIEKYDRFLVEYPAVLQGKGGMKAMKKVTQLGKLSAEADQDMKKAFRSFDEATQGA